MRRFLSLLAVALVATVVAPDARAQSDGGQSRSVMVVMETNKGDITLRLRPDKAPGTVENFLEYARDDFYQGTIFHRVVQGFVIQGGGFTRDLTRKKTRGPIENEADNGLTNERGTIAMARTADPHSATSQFFINVRDNGGLNFQEKTPGGWGYTVFGRVVDGMDVVDRISRVETGAKGPLPRSVPRDPIVIEDVRIKGQG